MDAPVHHVGDTLPAVLVLEDLARLLGISHSRAAHLAAAGEFDAFELTPRIGRRLRYSGAKLQRWLDGPTDAPASRFFQKGTRR